jgi:uncharacterized protein (DUF58 family)
MSLPSHAAPAHATGGPLKAWRRRWQAWWLRRLPASDTLVLTHRNVYILPTRPGLMLALTLLLLLVGSINYQLNLGYLLTFLIAGSTVVGMHMAHRNLRGLRLQLHPEAAVHAGQPMRIRIDLHNPDRRHRYGVGLAWWPQAGEPVWVDVPAADTHSVWLQWPTPARGWHPLPPLQLTSRFPLGTFAVWSWWQPASRVLVYPAIEAHAPPLPAGPADHGDTPPADAAAARRDEWSGIRPYQRGDALNELVWKLIARRDDDAPNGWVSREGARPPAVERWLDSRHCGLSETEAQRSRLCAWVLAAEQRGWTYGLQLPGQRLAPDQGPAHCRLCLEALACH